MLIGRSRDFTNHISYTANGIHNFVHGVTRVRDELRTKFHLFHRIFNERLDFFGCLGTALRQGTHFTRHHRKTSALLASASSFYRRVQSQDVGLESNAVNNANDVGNFFAAAVDFVHSVHHLLHHRAAFLRDTRGAGGQLRRLTGVVCAVLYVARQLLHGRGGSLQVARGLLGTYG